MQICPSFPDYHCGPRELSLVVIRNKNVRHLASQEAVFTGACFLFRPGEPACGTREIPPGPSRKLLIIDAPPRRSSEIKKLLPRRRAGFPESL